MQSRARIATITHFVEREGPVVTPLCLHWEGGSNWTTFPGIASCPDCRARLAELEAAHRAADPNPAVTE
jgi:hypothetical protein